MDLGERGDGKVLDGGEAAVRMYCMREEYIK